MDRVDTIAAIATPLGIGGIGVVRDEWARPPCPWRSVCLYARVVRHAPALKSHRMYHGFVVNGAGRAGRRECSSVSCGDRTPTPARTWRRSAVTVGCMTTQRVLEAVLAQGARVAEPGEFTKRAFLNGRLDLTQAEAVIDVINARTLASHRAAVRSSSRRRSPDICMHSANNWCR